MMLVVCLNEYLRRVRTRAFVLTTLLAPIAMAAIMGAAVAAIFFSVEAESARERTVAVLDESGRILPELLQRESETFRLRRAPSSLDAGKEAVLQGDTDLLVVLPSDLAEIGAPTDVFVYSREKLSITAEDRLRQFVLDVVRDVRLAPFALPEEVIQTINEQLSVTAVTVAEDGVEEDASGRTGTVVGLILGVALMMIMYIYGALVMQTAMEEKSSRMAEILVSSVRPFHLLLGKILALGGVAVTQLLVWGAMLVAFGVVVVALLPPEDLLELGLARTGDAAALAEATGMPNAMAGLGDMAGVERPQIELGIRFDVVVVVLFMLPLGYVINASLFGALGAMYETPQEAQVAVSIAMAPMVVAILMVQTVALAPNSVLVAFGSLFPFTSPVLLPARMLNADMPFWQVGLSVVLCAVTALGVVWLAGRMFRGSLLTYGKKLSFRDVRLILTGD